MCGRTSLIPDLAERLRYEVLMSNDPAANYQMSALPERGCLAWVGGSIQGSLSNFKDCCLSKSQYLEFGSEKLAMF